MKDGLYTEQPAPQNVKQNYVTQHISWLNDLIVVSDIVWAANEPYLTSQTESRQVKQNSTKLGIAKVKPLMRKI
jgi:hypothetical protein